jgi:HK97 family phage major capsid protein
MGKQKTANKQHKLIFDAQPRFYAAPVGDIQVIDAEKCMLRFSISSEYPVQRYDWNTDSAFWEVLSHRAADIDLSRFNDSASFRDEHWGDQLGVISDPGIVDDKLYITVTFSQDNPRAMLVFNDMKNGIRRNVSVRPEYTGPGVMDGIGEGGLRTIRFPWRPIHGAVVPDGADPTVGVGRSKQQSGNVVSLEYNNNKKEISKMDPELRKFLESLGLDRSSTEEQALAYMNSPEVQAKMAANLTAGNRGNTPHPNKPKVTVVSDDSVRDNERERITSITDMGRDFGMENEAKTAISENVSVDSFRAKVVEKLKDRKVISPVKSKDGIIGMGEKDLSRYSLVRAISLLVMDKNLDGIEREASDEASKQIGRSAKGFFIPSDVMMAPSPMRAQTVADAAKGGNLVQTNYMLGSMVEELYNAMVLDKMGVQMLYGLVGDMAIPTDDGGLQGYWLDENGVPTVSEFKIGQIGMTPHTVGAIVNLSRRLLIQTGGFVETFARQKIMRTLGLLIQKAALNGPGAKGQPKGLDSLIPDSNIVSIGDNGGVPTYKAIVGLESKIADENADFGTLAYLTNSAMRGQLKTTQEFDNVNGRAVWKNLDGVPGVGEMNGYSARVTNQVSRTLTKGNKSDCSAIYFGNWAAMILGYWSGLDITVDRTTEVKSGGVNIIALQDVDVAIERKVAFGAIKDARVG